MLGEKEQKKQEGELKDENKGDSSNGNIEEKKEDEDVDKDQVKKDEKDKKGTSGDGKSSDNEDDDMVGGTRENTDEKKETIDLVKDTTEENKKETQETPEKETPEKETPEKETPKEEKTDKKDEKKPEKDDKSEEPYETKKERILKSCKDFCKELCPTYEEPNDKLIERLNKYGGSEKEALGILDYVMADDKWGLCSESDPDGKGISAHQLAVKLGLKTVGTTAAATVTAVLFPICPIAALVIGFLGIVPTSGKKGLKDFVNYMTSDCLKGVLDSEKLINLFSPGNLIEKHEEKREAKIKQKLEQAVKTLEGRDLVKERDNIIKELEAKINKEKVIEELEEKIKKDNESKPEKKGNEGKPKGNDNGGKPDPLKKTQATGTSVCMSFDGSFQKKEIEKKEKSTSEQHLQITQQMN